MNTQMLKLIEQAQTNKKGELAELVQKFEPLLCKYSYLLKYEDAKQDLYCDFITLVLAIDLDKFVEKEDKFILSYIKKALHNSYIMRSKYNDKSKNMLPISALSEQQQYYIESRGYEDLMLDLLLTDLKNILNDNEFKVLYMHFFIELSIDKISQRLSISRQAVNQSKKRALEKLKQSFCRESA